MYVLQTIIHDGIMHAFLKEDIYIKDADDIHKRCRRYECIYTKMCTAGAYI